MENLPFCQTHSRQILNFLRSDNSELICGSCLLELVKTQKNFQPHQIIDLEQLHDHPEQVFQFTNILKFLPIEEAQINKFFEDQKRQLNGVKQKIEQLINEYDQMKQEYLEQWTTNFRNIIKYDEFQSILQNLKNLNRNSWAEAIQQAQKQFQTYFDQIRVIDFGINQAELLNLRELSKYMQNKLRSNGQYQEMLNLLTKANDNQNLFFQFGDCEFFFDLIRMIQDKVKKIQKHLKPFFKVWRTDQIIHQLKTLLLERKICFGTLNHRTIMVRCLADLHPINGKQDILVAVIQILLFYFHKL
ncbi:unnamed protein product (macronuclear) [Paramecium tetraurelia]|uniref:Uncharacterized protein n=1 Tax=Paramecium tetraurelia TaxID=5888 RepID=A0DF37_PARTE|nr:uncharacterized protein GSPATT00039473001 [Paramecium tetraurelia]CAK81654.1 unnamed protein product [Paramecium tetraurelia]|eukprot:XP_001449051.1 hypothetical protein (macronuclear) [Paramecium tetraurelia strain d4-2]